MRECPQCGLPVSREAPRCFRCGADLGAPELVDGRYAVEAEVGRGSMGVVYRATDVQLGRTVALKVISPDLARNATFVDRFRREANALASIRHQHVVHVFTMGVHAGSYFYAMEYVEGRNLEEIVREHARHGTHVPVYIALTILRQVALGLAAVHATGLVHRDVKPANIVIEDRTGRPVLLDFGLVRPAVRDAASATVTAGSPPYMAPEQIAPGDADEALGPPTDVYGLGCTAMEVLTGATPFSNETIYKTLTQQLHEPAPLLSSRRPELAMLDGVVARALEKNPADRYESAAAFAAALEESALRWRSLGTPLPPPLTAPPSEHPAPVDDAPGLRVLIVDDDSGFCRIASKAARLAMRERSVEVVEASSGIRALTACIERPPDLVLLDYDMPGPNGIDTLSELRSIPGAARAAVLVVSATVGDVERWRFSVLGVKDFLPKPVQFGALVDAIQRLATFAEKDTRPVVPDGPAPAGRDGDLPVEVFLALLAVGWADGRLDPAEREAVFAAAADAGLPEGDMETLRRAALSRVQLDDVNVSRLRTHERMYVYAVARWIAVLDGSLTELEAAMLRVLGFVLRMPPPAQAAVDGLVADVLADRDAAADRAAVLAGLRRAVRQRYASDAEQLRDAAR